MTTTFALRRSLLFTMASLSAIALLACASLGLAQAPATAAQDAVPLQGQKIFITGHSFHMFVPPLLTENAKLAGIEGQEIVGTQGIGGSTVTQHWDKAEDQNGLKKALRAGVADVYTCAPHLFIPDPAIEKIADLMIEKRPDARLLVQISWFPYDTQKNYDERRKKDGFVNADRDQAKIEDLRESAQEWHGRMSKQIREINAKLLPQVKHQVVYLVPVGAAVLKLRQNIVDGKVPGVTQSSLFTDPIGHVTAPIRMLTGYCHYAVIYGRSPVGLPVPPGLRNQNRPETSPEFVRMLQECAWEAVLNEPLSGVTK